MTDVLVKLMTADFRAITFPITARQYGFQQENASHKFIFVDDQIVDSLGRENPTYSYTIPFREDVVKAPWSHLFTKTYPEFLKACRNRSPGILTDPLHGPLKAKCVSLREQLDVNKKDGIDVEVEFIYAPELDELASNLGAKIAAIQGVKDQAGFFDDGTKKIDWKQETPPRAMLDPFDSLSSIGNQVEAAAGKFTAKIDDVAFRAGKAADTIERLKNPKLANVHRAARRLQIASTRLALNAGFTPQRPVHGFTTTSDMGFIALAGLLGNSVADFAKLNPMRVHDHPVKSGTQVRFYSSK